MSEIDHDGLHFVRSVRRGKPVRWYVYAWRGGPCIMKADSPVKPRLTREAVAALDQAVADDRAVKPDTVAGLIRRYRGNPADKETWSPEWAALAESTRETWGYALNSIELRWGRTVLGAWSDSRMVVKVIEWRDSRKATPRAADLGVQVLYELLKFAKLRGDVKINVAADIPTLYRGGDRADIIWTEEDYDRFGWHALRMEWGHVPDGLWLAGLTGFRRADLVTANETHVMEYALVKKALKTSNGKRYTVTMPRLPEMDRLLEELRARHRAEGVDNLLVNSFGRAWTPGGFTASFNAIRDAAGIVHVDPDTGEARKKHLHDVRGTYCTKLILAAIAAGQPLTDEEIAELMGWSPERVGRIRRTYVDQARVVVAIGERIRTKV